MNTDIKTVIVDDEPRAIELLEDYLGHFSNVTIAGTFRNGLKAFEFLKSKPVDLIFLDINMPHINGITLSRMVDKDVKIIFTTAYSEFAVESYEIGAADYLLKPITLDRFMMAMGRIMETPTSEQNNNPESIWIKSGAKTHKLYIDDIFYLHKEGNYMTYVSSDHKVLAREAIAESLSKLPNYFCQSHKSYIVNLKNVTSIDKETLYVGSSEIPIGVSFKSHIEKAIDEIIR